MFLLTGGLLIAVKAFITNIVTVAAGMGLLVLVFQRVLSTAGMEEANLVFLAALAFALATDYELFLISRIKEERDHGLANTQAVAAGITRTGPLITSAAVLFCVAVGSFATGQLTFIREFGVGAALMVLIDASIVRALLVPSLTVLLGRANWWAPAWLRAARGRFSRQPSRSGEVAEFSATKHGAA
jgi:RND superfamily putative drug exporter